MSLWHPDRIWKHEPRGLTFPTLAGVEAYFLRKMKMFMEDRETGEWIQLVLRRTSYWNATYRVVTIALDKLVPYGNQVAEFLPTLAIEQRVRNTYDLYPLYGLRTFSDKLIRTYVYNSGGTAEDCGLIARMDFGAGGYYNDIRIDLSTADHKLYRRDVGVGLVVLGTEAVDLSAGWFDLVLSCIGSTIKSSRDGGATFPITVTDTTYTSGYFGMFAEYYNATVFIPNYFDAPASPVEKPILYIIDEIIGDGSEDNPFRPSIAQLIENDPRLSVTYTVLFPPVKRGKFTKSECLVRIFSRRESQEVALRDITMVLDTIRSYGKVKVLTKDEAIRYAKTLNDLLHDADLKQMQEETAKDYISWRESQFKHIMKEETAKYYVKSDKGW